MERLNAIGGIAVSFICLTNNPLVKKVQRVKLMNHIATYSTILHHMLKPSETPCLNTIF